MSTIEWVVLGVLVALNFALYLASLRYAAAAENYRDMARAHFDMSEKILNDARRLQDIREDRS